MIIHAKATRFLMPIGMLCLALALAWPRMIHVAGNLGPNWTDAIRGLLLGLSIGLNLGSVIFKAGRCA